MPHACVSEFHNCIFTNLVFGEQNTVLQHVVVVISVSQYFIPNGMFDVCLSVFVFFCLLASHVA